MSFTFNEPRIDLLTAGEPRWDAESVMREFGRSIQWIDDLGDAAAEPAWECREGELCVAVGPHQLTARKLARSYWGGEDEDDDSPPENDIWEYGPRAAWMGEYDEDLADLENDIMDAEGAILIEAVEVPDRCQAWMLLCHLAASLMDEQCVAMIVPTSGALHAVTVPLCEALHESECIIDVLQYVLRIDMPPTGELYEYWCVAYGLHALGLPEVGMKFQMADDDTELSGVPFREANQTVQTVVADFLKAGKPYALGDTLKVDYQGPSQRMGPRMRVVAATFELYGTGPFGGLELLSAEGGPPPD